MVIGQRQGRMEQKWNDTSQTVKTIPLTIRLSQPENTPSKFSTVLYCPVWLISKSVSTLNLGIVIIVLFSFLPHMPLCLCLITIGGLYGIVGATLLQRVAMVIHSLIVILEGTPENRFPFPFQVSLLYLNITSYTCRLKPWIVIDKCFFYIRFAQYVGAIKQIQCTGYMLIWTTWLAVGQ